jgi:hypothetical protein
MCLKNNKMRFIDLWSESTSIIVPNRALYNLYDPNSVHISEAGATDLYWSDEDLWRLA